MHSFVGLSNNFQKLSDFFPPSNFRKQMHPHPHPPTHPKCPGAREHMEVRGVAHGHGHIIWSWCLIMELAYMEANGLKVRALRVRWRSGWSLWILGNIHHILWQRHDDHGCHCHVYHHSPRQPRGCLCDEDPTIYRIAQDSINIKYFVTIWSIQTFHVSRSLDRANIYIYIVY